MKAIIDKHPKLRRMVDGERKGKPCVHYRVQWEGYDDPLSDTWEPLENLQAERIKRMINELNASKRQRTQ